MRFFSSKINLVTVVGALILLSGPLAADDRVSIESFGDAGVGVAFNGDGQVAGVQFELFTGHKLTDDAIECGSAFDDRFIVSCFPHDEFVRVLVFSVESEPIPSGTLIAVPQIDFHRSRDGRQLGLQMTRDQRAAKQLQLQNVILVDSLGNEIGR